MHENKAETKEVNNQSEISYHTDYIETNALEELIRLCKTL